MKINDKIKTIIEWILIAVLGVIFSATMIFSVWWSITQDPDTIDTTPVEIVGTYEVRDLHDESIPANIKVIAIYLNNNPKERLYWYGTLNIDACKAGDSWTSTAYNTSDEKHKQFECYPDTGEIYNVVNEKYIIYSISGSMRSETRDRRFEADSLYFYNFWPNQWPRNLQPT